MRGLLIMCGGQHHEDGWRLKDEREIVRRMSTISGAAKCACAAPRLPRDDARPSRIAPPQIAVEVVVAGAVGRPWRW